MTHASFPAAEPEVIAGKSKKKCRVQLARARASATKPAAEMLVPELHDAVNLPSKAGKAASRTEVCRVSDELLSFLCLQVL